MTSPRLDKGESGRDGRFGLPAAVPEHGVGRSKALMTAFLVSYGPYPRAYAFASRRYLTEAIYILIMYCLVEGAYTTSIGVHSLILGTRSGRWKEHSLQALSSMSSFRQNREDIISILYRGLAAWGDTRVLTKDCIQCSAGAWHRTSTLLVILQLLMPKPWTYSHGQQAAAWGRTRNY